MLDGLLTKEQINQSLYNNVFADPSKMAQYMANPANARVLEAARGYGYGKSIDDYTRLYGAQAGAVPPAGGAGGQTAPGAVTGWQGGGGGGSASPRFPAMYSDDDAWGNPISGGGQLGPRSSGLVSGGGGAPWGGTPWGNGSSPMGTGALVSSQQPTQSMRMAAPMTM